MLGVAEADLPKSLEIKGGCPDRTTRLKLLLLAPIQSALYG